MKTKEEILYKYPFDDSFIDKYYEEEDVLKAMQEYSDQQTKELRDEISMKTKYYEDKLEHQHIALSEHYKENVLLKEEIERLKGNKWISVEERLPEEKSLGQSNFVLTFNGTHFNTNIYDHELKRWSTVLKHSITHWQPLPNNPI